jgi:hypothetical protein
MAGQKRLLQKFTAGGASPAGRGIAALGEMDASLAYFR